MAVKKLRAVLGGKSAEGHRSPPTPRDLWQAGLGDSTRALLDADRRAFIAEATDRDVIERAHGALLIDRDGREILDFDGAGAHSIGYGHPRVIAAVTEQIEALAFSPPGYTNPASIALAQRLAELAPGDLSSVLLASSNSGALCAALSLVRSATGRHKVLTFGDSIERNGIITTGIDHAPPLDQAERSWGNDGRGYERLADLVDRTLSRGEVAAVIAEPMDWVMVVPPPADFWRAVKASCERRGTLLVFDETASAVGRTGTMFYAEQAGAVPDVLVVGTGLGGGVVPVAAVIAGDLPAPPTLEAVASEKNPVAAAAALATLEVIAEDDLLERARGLGHRGLDHLKDIAARFPIFREARGVGLTLGLELAEPAAEERAEKMLYACLERGLSFRLGGGRVIALTPPLTISVPEIERTFQIIEAAAAGC